MNAGVKALVGAIEESNERGLMRVPVLRCLLLGVCVVLAVGVGSASAAQSRKLVNTFGSLSEPRGVAVDQSNSDVYLADTGGNRVEKFDALGNLLVVFGADVGGPGVDTCSVLCGVGTSGSAPGEFTSARFVAVDNDPGSASFRDVYVGDPGDGLVSKFDSSGSLIGSWGVGGQLDGSTATDGPFAGIAGVAVDASGDLLVIQESNRVFVFAQDGTFTTDFATARGTLVDGLAVDGAGDLFKVNGDGSVEKLDAAGSDVGTVTPDAAVTLPVAAAIAVEPVSGDLYVVTAGQALEHYAFNGSGEVIEPDGSTCVVVREVGCGASDSFAVSVVGGGVGVSSVSGDAYVSDPVSGQVDVYAPLFPEIRTGQAANVQPTTATLNGTVNPIDVQLSDCHFDYGTTTAYGQSAPCVPAAGSIAADSSEHAVSADITGLTPGATYHFRLQAANVNGANQGQDATFETPPPPSVDSATATGLTSTSVDLNARIDPNGADTHYRFEYGTSTSYGASVPVPDADIGGGSSAVPVSHHITGLAGDTTYHWRVVASNARGIMTGSDHTFRYDMSGGGLPDGRAYEMVTPPHKNGSLIGDVSFVGNATPDISDDGSRMIASSIQCFAGATSCNAQKEAGVGSPYEFTRTGSGWVAKSLAPPASVLSTSVSWGYSAETGMALFSSPTAPFGEDDFYVRQPDGTLANMGPITPPGGGPQGPLGGRIMTSPQALTADLSHFVWETSWDAGRWPSFDASTYRTLYEYAGLGNAQPLLVGVSGGQSSTDLISKCSTRLGGTENTIYRGALSDDGRVVFFTAYSCLVGGSGLNTDAPVPADEVFARVDGESADAHTVAVSSSSECGPGEAAGEKACREAQVEPGDALFIAGSADGAKAFFTSTQQLTDDASKDNHVGDTASELQRGCALTVGVNGCNLYEYDLEAGAGHHLQALSAGDVSGGGPRVQGVMAVSADGSHVYFVAKGVLTTAANSEGESAQTGANNLYVFERDAAHPSGRVAFVTSMPETDLEEWALRAGSPANVSENGRFLVFLSHGRLTRDDSSVGGAYQVFRYDAQTGVLVRVSVGEGGFNDDGNRSSPTPCGAIGCSEDARIVPGLLSASRSDPSMSADGARVFFQSPVGLTPKALDDVRIGTDPNGNPIYVQNVYEWEGGHVYLISDGRDVSVDAGQEPDCGLVGVSSSVCLLGVDATGADVFFSTADGLVGQDTDGEVDYYDARVCTAGDPCVKQPAVVSTECEGDGCRGASSSPPSLSAPSSVGFSGAGNLTPTPVSKTVKHPVRKKPRVCAKGRRRSHSHCVKVKHRGRAGKAAGKARSSRGGK